MKNLLRNKIKIISKLPFVRSYYEGVATIFMLHRVHPFEDNKLFSNENMKVSPEFLEMFITQLKSEGYEFINLDRLYDILQNKESTKKKIVLTLDDGYKDNYEIAYPIFKKHKIPFTIYLTTSFPEKKAILWWYILEDLIMEYDEIKLSKNRIFKCKTNKEKERVFLEIRLIIISLKQDNFLDELNDLFESNDIDWYSKINELSMNWKQIIDISNNDLCTIAGHTKNHYALNGLKMDKVLEEINQANQLIELKIGKK
jgi:peptidoglycan/xylan/chitin deacetylase (PgdA/CDA1 family)